MKRRAVALSVLAIAAAAVTAALLLVPIDAPSTDSPAETTVPRSTAPVVRRDISETSSFDGTVTYRDTRMIMAPELADDRGTPTSATVTTIVDVGDPITEGTMLFSFDREPTVVITGDVPMYRSLSSSSSDGPDVRQLEAFLVAAGFDPDAELTVDEEYTSKTGELVERWEESLGLSEPDGDVDQGQVVFLPGDAIATEIQVGVGETVTTGTPVLDIVLPGNGRVVQVDVPLSDQNEVEIGTTVAIVAGDVAGTGVVESTLPSAHLGPADEAMATVVVAVDDPFEISQVTAPADIEVTEVVADDVLVVPVTALVALAEGGYAIEVVLDGGGTKLTAVTPGHFGDNMVEITGPGVADGDLVVTP